MRFWCMHGTWAAGVHGACSSIAACADVCMVCQAVPQAKGDCSDLTHRHRMWLPALSMLAAQSLPACAALLVLLCAELMGQHTTTLKVPRR